MISFDKIVNKMLKKWWNLFFKDDIFEIFDPEKKPEYITQVNKIIYRLKSEKVIIPIRNWVYLVPEKNDADLTEIDLIEKYYFKLLKKYLSENCSSDYYISWKKSLEFHLKNYGVPEKIFIVNRNKHPSSQGDYYVEKITGPDTRFSVCRSKCIRVNL